MTDSRIPAETLELLEALPAHLRDQTVDSIVRLVAETYWHRLGKPVPAKPTPDPSDRPAVRGLGAR